MSKLSELVEGYRKLWKIGEVPDKEEETVAQKRMEICMACPHRNTHLNTCKVCTCYLPAKTKCMQCSCPKQYW